MNKTLLKEVAARFTDDYKLILKKIKEYNHIVVFRHQMPDFDALGTQSSATRTPSSKVAKDSKYILSSTKR